ncbi:unnamed protein product [Protopolystoma xenopodis]|uniref:Uncharacterized protein n=1 Tax=Protopolystoma xenopodis TaxID=117903 RepID=A0A448WFX7_9PLAT|nr:unnamed protein product [Protopolystoma xenopodis]
MRLNGHRFFIVAIHEKFHPRPTYDAEHPQSPHQLLAFRNTVSIILPPCLLLFPFSPPFPNPHLHPLFVPSSSTASPVGINALSRSHRAALPVFPSFSVARFRFSFYSHFSLSLLFFTFSLFQINIAMVDFLPYFILIFNKSLFCQYRRRNRILFRNNDPHSFLCFSRNTSIYYLLSPINHFLSPHF